MPKPTQLLPESFNKAAGTRNSEIGLLKPLSRETVIHNGEPGHVFRMLDRDGKPVNTFMNRSHMEHATDTYRSRLDNPNYPHSAENLATIREAYRDVNNDIRDKVKMRTLSNDDISRMSPLDSLSITASKFTKPDTARPPSLPERESEPASSSPKKSRASFKEAATTNNDGRIDFVRVSERNLEGEKELGGPSAIFNSYKRTGLGTIEKEQLSVTLDSLRSIPGAMASDHPYTRHNLQQFDLAEKALNDFKPALKIADLSLKN